MHCIIYSRRYKNNKLYTYIMYFLVHSTTFIVICIFVSKCIQKLIYKPCTSKVCLVGKTAIVTGGNKGIGYETSLGLAARGCKVIIACRSNTKQVKENIIKITNNPNIIDRYLDLSSLASVRKFCKEIHETEERIDILINNAGISADVNVYTEDGLHPTMQTNLFGSFLLTHLLVDLLKKAGNARIIFVSSLVAYVNNLSLTNLNGNNNKTVSSWYFWQIYGNSKAGQIIVSNEFAAKLKPFGITSNALYPGVVETEIYDKLTALNLLSVFLRVILHILLFLFAKTPEEGAQRSLTLATSDSYKKVTGTCLWHLGITPSCTRDKAFRKKIWKQIEDYVKLAEDEKI